MKINLSDIRRDGGTQTRAFPYQHEGTVKEYAEEMAGGTEFPPVVVFFDGEYYWLADGFHRVEAALQNELEQIEADVKEGTQRDAILFSVGANDSHGLRRTNSDKRKSVEILLKDIEWGKCSDREISRMAKVSHPTVSAIRSEIEASGKNYQMPKTRKVTRAGKTYEMNISGQRDAPAIAQPKVTTPGFAINVSETQKYIQDGQDKEKRLREIATPEEALRFFLENETYLTGQPEFLGIWKRRARRAISS